MMADSNIPALHSLRLHQGYAGFLITVIPDRLEGLNW
jgi:hypothetical protein